MTSEDDHHKSAAASKAVPADDPRRRPRKITLLNQFYRPDISPTAQLTASLAEHRASKGDVVTVVSSGGKYVGATSKATDDRPDGPRVIRLWTPSLGKSTPIRRILDYLIYYLGAAWTVMRLPPQDILIPLTTPPYIVLLAILHRALNPGAKIVWWSMDCYPDALERSGKLALGSWRSRIMRRLNRFAMRRVDRLVCLDTAMVDLLVTQYSSANRPVPTSIVPNWEDLALFPRTESPPPWPAAETLGIRDKFVVLYLGNTGVGHAFETVLDAAEALRDEPVVFLFIGGGSRWTSIAEAVKSRGLTNVIQHDYVAKELTPAVMGAADLALITLRDEALGVMSPSKLHANLAAALPVLYIGPATSNVDDAIRRFDCGQSLRHGDVAGAISFIRSMMSDQAKRGQLRTNARHAFENAYCDRVTLPQFDSIIDSV